MRTKKGKKILSLMCAMIILFTTICPSITLATNEITNIINNENLIIATNLEDTKPKDKKETNVINNNLLDKQTNEIIDNKNNINENILDISNNQEDKMTNEEKDNKEEMSKKKIEQEEIIEVVENEEEFIKRQQEKELENSKNSMKKMSLYSTRNISLYVIQLASYISTTVHNRADGYGILVRKIATNSSYSDVKQAFCIEMRRRFKLRRS